MKTKAFLGRKLRGSLRGNAVRTLRAIGAPALLGALLSACVVGCDVGTVAPSYEGEFVVQAGVRDDGGSAVRYVLRMPGEPDVELEFAEVPRLNPGTRIRVTGEALSERKVRVDAVEVLEGSADGIGTVQQRATTVNGVTTRRVAVLMLESTGATSVTQQTLRNYVFDATTSANAYYNENSFGKLRFTGDVFGWLHIASSDCVDVALAATQAQAAAASAGINLASYDHVAYYLGNCGSVAGGHGGWGDVGAPASPARHTWYPGQATAKIFAHELGHNVGHWHSNYYDCGNSVISTPANCGSIEYGNFYTVMGVADGNGHFGAYNKAAQNWFQSCNVVTTPKTSVFNIAPIESSTTGVQAVRVPMSPSFCREGESPCYYYLETRRAIGQFDGSSIYAGTPM